MRIFTTPFNHLDGYGDGPIDPANTTQPGGRPTLQGNGMFLRINGLDAQACFECHTLVSNATIPATLGLGGAGLDSHEPAFTDVRHHVAAPATAGSHPIAPSSHPRQVLRSRICEGRANVTPAGARSGSRRNRPAPC